MINVDKGGLFLRRSKKMLYNTLLLTGASMLMSAVGVAFQTYLAGRIGVAGIGLFQLIASAQMLAMTFALSGIRFATTRLVSEQLGRQGGCSTVHGVMRRCFVHALLFGTAAAILLFWGAPWIGKSWIGDSRTILSLRILAVSLPFVASFAVMSGYFTAVGRVAKTVSGQVVQQMIRISLVVGLLIVRPPSGLEAAAATVVIGGIAAEVFSTLILFALYLRDKGKFLPKHSTGDEASGNNLTRRLLAISMPLAVSTYVRSGLNTLQHMLIPRGLRRAGTGGEDALAHYGIVHGMVFPIILFPSSLFYAVAELMVPELTAAQVAGQTERISHLVTKLLRIAIYIAVGLAGVFLVFGRELGTAIHPGEPEVGQMIRVFALLMPIMFLDAISDGMLKGLGQQVYSMGVNIADSLISVVLIFFLLPIFGVWGYVWIVYFTEAFNFGFSIYRIAKLTKIRLTIADFLKPALSILAAIQFTILALRTLNLPAGGVGNLVAHFLLAGLAYVLLLRALGCISRQDLRWARKLVAK